MILRQIVSRIVVAAALATPISAVATTASFAASSGDQVFFLWGGDEDRGGGRHSVSFSPKYSTGQIIVSFGDRRLYHVVRPGMATSYPIAIPRDQSRWEGATTVSMKRENPSWTPTAEMLHENPRLPSWVPGGHPMNPLGVRALYLGTSTYRIHGTDAPWTIGQAVSKGCIRMYNEDVLDLYPRVNIGSKVTVTWQTFATNPVADSAPAVEEEPIDKPRKQARRAQGPQQRMVTTE